MNGIILINKEKDYTSHDVVAIAKKTLGEKIGHTGTLDPNATGVLPLLIGKATGISKYLINHDKKYQAVLKLGIKTDTADSTGKIIEEITNQDKANILSKQTIEEVLSSMQGKQTQVPPMYSAIKIKGKKLYEYARAEKQVEVPSREIEIYSLKLDQIDQDENEITFTVHCSKGTYIRTLCEQIAEKLGQVGHMKELIRLQVGEFKIENSVKIKELKDNLDKIITIEQFFCSKPKITLDNIKMQKFLNGVKLMYELEEDVYKVYNGNDEFIGLGTVKNNILKRDVIL